MNIGCIITLIDIEKVFLSMLSITFAAVIVLALKKYNMSTKTKIFLIYSHLVFLFFPLVLLTTNFACGALCMSCYNKTVNLIIYALPSTFLLSTLAGFIVIPSFYMMSNKKREIKSKELLGFVRKQSANLGIKTPKLYAVDKAKPVAFSFRSYKSAIFLSIGLLDIMKKKEIEAVILHELSHIKQKASAMKLSSHIMRFSPLSALARFHHDSGADEYKADRFAVRIQKTNRYIKSAKRKVDRFNK